MHAVMEATAPTTEGLIAPHGGVLVDRLVAADEVAAWRECAAGLPVITLTDTQLADLEMIAVGAMSPLTGFLTRADYERVVEECRLEDGTVWSLPITLRVETEPTTDQVALAAAGGTLVAIMDVAEVWRADRKHEAGKVYGTTDVAHPGVAVLMEQGEIVVGGPVRVFEMTQPQFPASEMTPAQTRQAFAQRGWKTIVGFQTRNPVHRAHEYIVKTAMETVDGLLLHPLVGRTKDGDTPADVRMRCYEVLLTEYFPADRVLLGVFPAAMRYAGPREAIFHAMCRKNYGCSHFIVGRDHAGVGTYYGTYDAQAIFDGFTREELGVEIMRFEHSFYCKVCDSMASAKTCPHDREHHVFLSGTAVREMLGRGEVPPVEFSRPEVAQVLIEAYRS